MQLWFFRLYCLTNVLVREKKRETGKTPSNYRTRKIRSKKQKIGLNTIFSHHFERTLKMTRVIRFSLLLLLQCEYKNYLNLTIHKQEEEKTLNRSSRVAFSPLTFCVLRELNFSPFLNLERLNSNGGNFPLKGKWNVRRNSCRFDFKSKKNDQL